MINRVFPSTFKQIKIFWTIICFDLIYMMDNFFFRKISFKKFFCYESVFWNISTIIRRMMVWLENQNIASAHNFVFTLSRLFCPFLRSAHIDSEFKRNLFPCPVARITNVGYRQILSVPFRKFFTFVPSWFPSLRKAFAHKRTIFSSRSMTWFHVKLFLAYEA